MAGLRKSSVIFAVIAALLLLAIATQVHGYFGRQNARITLAAKKAMVAELGLTDLCLFTEARYTRHLSQADLHTPFQDHPVSLEHFPSGSLLAPPDLLRNRHEQLVP